jgi:electron transfer flavoprotein beta subunit
MLIGVAVKLVDRRPEIDPLTGVVHADHRSSGLSPSDEAALEWALRCADAWAAEVLVVTAGPQHSGDVLRDALTVGAHRALRIDLPAHATSEDVAAALAGALQTCVHVWCGDYSLDRGSGSVPAYLAAHLGAQQALGLVQVTVGEPGEVEVLRRLDGGRRERLRVTSPAVVSVEGSTARLRRAALAASLQARSAPVEVWPGPAIGEEVARVARPFRPRARVLPVPAGATARERILALTDAHAEPTASTETVTLEPAEAAERILAALDAWGYRER